MRFVASLVTLLVLSPHSAAEAQQVAVAGQLGTTGLGASVAYSVVPRLNVRGAVGFIPFEAEFGVHDVDFDMEFPTVLRAVADYYPLDTDFHVSAGLFFVTGPVEGQGVLLNPKRFGDEEYSPMDVGTLNGTFDPSHVQPYVGAGYGNPIGPKVAVQVEGGVAFGRKPEVQLRSLDGRLADDPDFQADLDAEEEAFRDDISDLWRIFPVVTVSLSFGVS